MLIRKNSKEFKAIRAIFHEYRDKPSREKLISLYITKAGHSVQDKIPVDSLHEQKQVYYDLTYDSILKNLHSEDHQLHQSEDGSQIYYFHSTSNKLWDETPFQLDEKLRKKFAEYSKVPVPELKTEPEKLSPREPKETHIPHLRPPVKRESEKPVEEKPTSKKFPELRLREKRVLPDHTRVTFKPSPARTQDESTVPDYHLKHPLEFHQVDKILFPYLDITKKDVLDYYNEVAEVMLPFLKDRPQFFRWHTGGIKESQYNKSIEGLLRDRKGTIPSWIKTVKTHAVTYNEERTYMLCPDKAHLLFLVELGCVEINAWHSRIKTLDNPDFVVIDLDPVDIGFDKVIEVARAAKTILDGLQLPSFVKTSGNKGLHIYITLDAKSDYETAKSVSEFLCRLIHLKLPQFTSLLRMPEQRKGKVYLDFLQNAKGKSIVAPYSLRPNEFAGVATPLYWEEVKEGLKLTDFTFKTVRKRLTHEGDPFKELMKKKVNAETLLKRLKENYSFLL